MKIALLYLAALFVASVATDSITRNGIRDLLEKLREKIIDFVLWCGASLWAVGTLVLDRFFAGLALWILWILLGLVVADTLPWPAWTVLLPHIGAPLLMLVLQFIFLQCFGDCEYDEVIGY
ncbi:MAG: hypothetical protein WC536_03170 [Patescibacteria group bacterium]